MESVYGGIGFTMSLFIENLSFKNAELLEFSKVGALVCSIVSDNAGYNVLSRRTEYGGKNQQQYDVPEHVSQPARPK